MVHVRTLYWTICLASLSKLNCCHQCVSKVRALAIHQSQLHSTSTPNTRTRKTLVHRYMILYSFLTADQLSLPPRSHGIPASNSIFEPDSPRILTVYLLLIRVASFASLTCHRAGLDHGLRAHLSNGFSNRSTTTSLLARPQARSLPGFMAPTLTSCSPSPEPGSIITAGCGPGFLGRVSVPLTAVDHPALADTSCSTNEDSLIYGGGIHGDVSPMVMGACILIPRSLSPRPKLTLTPICER